MKAIMSSNFGQFATESWPLIDVRIEFAHILKTNRLIKTKFCIHIIIDKIYIGIVNCCLSQICYRVTYAPNASLLHTFTKSLYKNENALDEK